MSAQLGKKGYYSEKEEVELGSGGFYSPEVKPTGKQVAKPAASSRVSRNLPLLLLLVLVAAAIAYFGFVYKPVAGSGLVSFDLVVTAGEARVANATVQVYRGVELVGEGVTDLQGKVTFASLPGDQRLEFQVLSEQGRARQAVDLAQLRVYRIDLKGKAVASRESISLVLKNVDGLEPIEGLKVSYSLGNGNARFFAQSDSRGRVDISLRGESVVRLRVVDPQGRFEPRSDVILATRPVGELLLRAKSGIDNNLVFSPAGGQNVSFSVSASVESGLLPPGGRVTVLDSETGIVLSTAVFSNGVAELTAHEGSEVDLTVSVEGFYPVQINRHLVAVGGVVSVSLVAIASDSTRTKVAVSNLQGAVVEGAVVYIVPFESLSVLASATSQASGVAEFDLSDGSYYAIASKEGFLPGVSRVFERGEEVALSLLEDNEENGAVLEVAVRDEEGGEIAGASVAVTTDDGRLAALPVETGFALPARFSLAFGNFEARASFEGNSASKQVSLEGDSLIEINLITSAAFLDLRVLNLADDLPISAEITSFHESRNFASCSGNGGCSVPVKSGEDVFVEVESPGFLPYSYYSPAIPKGATKRDSIHLVSSADSALRVEFLGAFDLEGNPLGSALRSGSNYVAKFFISSQSADKLSLYARVDPGRVNVSSGTVHFTEPLSVEGVDVAKSTVYLGPNPNCVDLEQTELNEPYAWVEFTFNGVKSQEVSIPFTVPSSVGNSTFALQYRGKSIAGNVNARFPVDNILGFAESSAEKADCYADTSSVELETFTATGSLPVVEFPQVSMDFTAGDALYFNPSSGKIESRQGLASYEMQVDSILPADALPLALQSDARCRVLLGLPNASLGQRSENADCYSFDPIEGKLVFATREVNSRCPIHLKKDKFYNTGENIVTRDEAVITLSTSCSPEVKKTIPVAVNLVSLPSFSLQPGEDKLGEGNSVKLLYAINNRQLSRIVEVSSLRENTAPVSREFQLGRGSAKAFAWRGPGSVEFTESDSVVGEVNFADGNSPFKPGIGTLGYRASSCSQGDLYCCSSNWCTRKALEDQVETFKELSNRVAGTTVFRRGEGMPFAYFFKQPFKFATVVQTVQGSQASLRAGGVNFSSASPCISGNPGVYELAGFSTGSNWNYTARTLQLTGSDYLQPVSSCGLSSGETQPSFTAGNGSLSLCNFLQPVNDCIESTPNATVTSLDQVEKLRFSLTNCMYPVFPAAPVCPGNRMVLPAVNIINYKSETEFDASNSPNAFKKLFTAVSTSNASRFSVFSWQGQLRCIVPPSFQQFAISAAGSIARDVPNYAEQEARQSAPSPARITSDVCARPDFFGFASVPNLDTLIPLAGVCCAGGPSSGATHCTPRRGKFFISVQDNEIKVITQWGLTEGCYPYWPFPTSLRGLIQGDNLASVGFGMAQFMSSNGANFEMSLASQRPGEVSQSAGANGVTAQACSSDSNCGNREQCAVSSIYSYNDGKCIGGTCVYSTVREKQQCEGGMQCTQPTVDAAACQPCGGVGQRCCIERGTTNVLCKSTAGCLVQGSSYTCVGECGGRGQPVCGGINSQPRCDAGPSAIRTPFQNNLDYSTCAS